MPHVLQRVYIPELQNIFWYHRILILWYKKVDIPILYSILKSQSSTISYLYILFSWKPSLYTMIPFAFLDWAGYLPFAYPELYSVLLYLTLSWNADPCEFHLRIHILSGFLMNMVSGSQRVWWKRREEKWDQHIYFPCFLPGAAHVFQPKATAPLKLTPTDSSPSFWYLASLGLRVIIATSPKVLTTV